MNHTISKELAERMQKLGWNKETEHYWTNVMGTTTDNRGRISLNFYWNVVVGNPKSGVGSPENVFSDAFRLRRNQEITFPAPIAEEILEELPARIKNKETSNNDNLRIMKSLSGEYIAEYHTVFTAPLVEVKGQTLTEALGLLYCELKEQGLI